LNYVRTYEHDGVPRPREDEPIEDFEERCLAALKQMPMCLLLPPCLAEEHGRLTKYY
jgi:hypothetical protein